MSERACPLCGSPLYGWLKIPDPSTRPTVGAPVADDGARVLDRCEDCGAGVEAGGGPVDLQAELRAVQTTFGDGSPAVLAANRTSWQASLGGEGWAAIDVHAGRLLLTPRSLALLVERTGATLGEVGFPPMGANQRWMWQTLINGLTLHPNFAREVRAGRLRMANARSRLAFVADCIATVLAAPFVFLASFPLELIGALARRGGAMVAPLEPPANPGRTD
ncbi:MAG: hypothetical protein ACR2G3_09640 [Solirubrobacterales bacterium]